MKTLIAILGLVIAFNASAKDEVRGPIAIQAAKNLYDMNISGDYKTKAEVPFIVTQETCGGENEILYCKFNVVVQEKAPEKSDISYQVKMANFTVLSVEQKCEHCF